MQTAPIPPPVLARLAARFRLKRVAACFLEISREKRIFCYFTLAPESLNLFLLFIIISSSQSLNK